MPDPVFAEYHRRKRRRRVGEVSIVIAAIAATVGVAGCWAAAAPAAVVGAVRTDAGRASSTRTAVPDPPTSTSPVLVGDVAASAVAPAPVARPSGPTRIDVTAHGYQAELDACQWVRMDLEAAAPIVGAHTRCGGAIVLTLDAGDEVDIRGELLDGDYRVVSAREAHAGDPAGAATAGMVADVLLQTCFPGSGGRVRLVALSRFG
jgi:hypothetical protein